MTTTSPTVTVLDSQWSDIYADVDGSAPRLRAQILIEVGDTTGVNYGKVNLTAICVTDLEEPDFVGRWQEAVNSEDAEDLDRLFEIVGQDGPFDHMTIGGAGDGRNYVVFATP